LYRAVNTLRLDYNTSQLMLYSEIIAVCSKIHINILCWQNVELLNVKHGGIYNNHLFINLAVISSAAVNINRNINLGDFY
jgi:hypothetical protein